MMHPTMSMKQALKCPKVMNPRRNFRAQVDTICAANLYSFFISLRSWSQRIPSFVSSLIYRSVHLKCVLHFSLFEEKRRSREARKRKNMCVRFFSQKQRSFSSCLSRHENRHVSHGKSTIENGKITNIERGRSGVRNAPT